MGKSGEGYIPCREHSFHSTVYAELKDTWNAFFVLVVTDTNNADIEV